MVRAQIRHAWLTPKKEQEVTHLRSLEPTSISWSNMCDYTTVPDLHRLAHACSLPTTQHFMHSIDWVNDVKGANVVDFSNIKDRIQIRCDAARVRT